MNTIESLGFIKNTKIINGLKPHYIKPNYTNEYDLLFIIGANFHPSKICRIKNSFKTYKHKIYGIKTDKSPTLAYLDWISYPSFILLNLNPLGLVTWNYLGTDTKLIKIDSLNEIR
jgi:hypothetical protein